MRPDSLVAVSSCIILAIYGWLNQMAFRVLPSMSVTLASARGILVRKDFLVFRLVMVPYMVAVSPSFRLLTVFIVLRWE